MKKNSRDKIVSVLSMVNCYLVSQIALFSLVSLLLMGCIPSKQPPLKIDYYTLDYEVSQTEKIDPLPVTIGIDRFTSAPEFRSDRIMYQEKKATLSAYSYHRWRATPADLVTYYLARDLQALGSFMAVSSPAGRLTPAYRVEGVVDKFLEADIDENWYAVLSLTITLVRATEPDISKQVLVQQSFSETILCKEKQPLSVSEAMSAAMLKISGRINSLLVEKLR